MMHCLLALECAINRQYICIEARYPVTQLGSLGGKMRSLVLQSLVLQKESLKSID